MTQTNESTVAAHVGVRLIELMTRQHERIYHAIVTLAAMLDRLESHVEAIEQSIARIEAYTNGEKP